MGTLMELKVLESHDGYKMEYTGDKNFWTWRYGHYFRPESNGWYVARAGFCTIRVKELSSGFEVEFIGDKKKIQESLLSKLPR
jgi:hypothetical protein